MEVQPTEPYTLIIPTYGMGNIPPQFLNFIKTNDRLLITGVIGSGNTNFGETYCLAAEKISDRLQVPLLYKFELLGTPEDVVAVKGILANGKC